MNADSSASKPLLLALIGKEAVRETAQKKVRSLSPEAQLQLMGYAPQEEEGHRNLPARLYASIAQAFFPSPPDNFHLIIARLAVMLTIADVVEDPRFIAPLLDVLAIFLRIDVERRERNSPPPLYGTQFHQRQARISILPFLAYENSSVQHRIKIYDALKRTLAHRQPADSVSFTPEQKQALLMPLNAPYRDVELTELVLEVLKQIGETEPIPLLERIIAVEAVTENMQRVQKAAQECVSFLRLRAKHGQQAQTLLRASDPGTPDELLRPVAQADQTPPEELLRGEGST